MQTINRFNASLGIFCGPLKNPQSWRKFICGCSSIVACVLDIDHFFLFLCHISLLGDVWTQATVIIWWLGKRELETKARFKRRATAVRQLIIIYYKVLKLSKICDKTRNLESPAFLELWKFWVNIWFFEQIFWRKQSLSAPVLKGKHRIVKTR